ncbi:hypothetical protein BDN70DRAFT_899592 [Pholiota conissans]|uniref:Uncharacterized protein n=1 Tax=Pholiota conissans TaxID=109636 RepID=A0A9P5YS58_9AGAR|nr:hypothetical protein BDN70DRAFT_899592 [Pholiota conissans]
MPKVTTPRAQRVLSHHVKSTHTSGGAYYPNIDGTVSSVQTGQLQKQQPPSASSTNANHQSLSRARNDMPPPPPPPPAREEVFHIINKTTPSHIRGFKDGAVYLPEPNPKHEGQFTTQIITNSQGVTYIYREMSTDQYRSGLVFPPSTAMQIDEKNLWNSRILEGFSIKEPIPVKRFLKPVNDGQSTDKVIVSNRVSYLWSYNPASKKYTLTDKQKTEGVKFCELQVHVKNELGRNIADGAVVTIYDYEKNQSLYDSIIASAVIFLNDHEKLWDKINTIDKRKMRRQYLACYVARNDGMR